MASRRLMGLVIVVSIGAGAGAVTYSGGAEYTAGSGDNEATIAVDFDLGNYFLFTYRWDGDATGWDALSAIDQAGSLAVEATDFGEWGMFVDDLDYPGGLEYDYGEGINTGWSYCIGDNESWSSSPVGVSFYPLSDGEWNSWVWTNYDESWMPVRGPGEQPIPEPGTLALLGLGVLLVRKRFNW
ncbi:MAG: PEP-CTERM sorting domain-containing protein [Planctomycetota bacterium]|jgi:hypothetical protein